MAASEPSPDVFSWLKNLPLAPEYHPTVAEFQDPITYIFKIEKEASKYGICKIVPPVPPASKKTAITNLNRSLAARAGANFSSTSKVAPTFTTRQQQIGFCPRKPHPVKRPVWQSGEHYTFQQFEAKAKVFEKQYLKKFGKKGGFSGLEMETLFWKASVDKPFSVEYANDMPGSAFAAVNAGKGRREAGDGANVGETAWNMRGVSRAKTSLLRFMKEEIPGVTSPMVYIAMMFSWFAWHVEDHDLHSLNYLHMGAGKTWYGVPREAAVAFEEVVRVHGYGGEINPLVTFAILGEKTTVMSPEVFIGAGIPCCRLVQNAGEFVVTFPRAYHSGFSHGFNCGEAANIATPAWLTVAKDAAIRRASINYPPMVSHIQLLYDLALVLCSRVPREIDSEPRSSRLKGKKKGEGETMVKELFVQSVIQNNDHLHILGKGCSIVLLPQNSSDICANSRIGSQLRASPRMPLAFSSPKEAIRNSASLLSEDIMTDGSQGMNQVKGFYSVKHKIYSCEHNSDPSLTVNDERESISQIDGLSDQRLFSCATCGILTFACFAIIQPKEPAARYLMSADCSFFNDWTVGSGVTDDGFDVSRKNESTSEHNYAKGYSVKSVPDGLYDVPVQSAHYEVRKEIPSNGMASTSGIRKDTSALGLLALNYGNSSDSEEDPIEADAPTYADKAISMNRQGFTVEDHSFSLSNSRIDWEDERSTFRNKGTHTFDCPVEFETESQTSIHSISLDGIRKQMKVSGITANCPLVTHNSERLKSGKAIVPADETDVSVVRRSDEDSCRMHVFCLEHAIEVEQQLRQVGGVHMMLLCHPDYPKVESEAKLVAEELGISNFWNNITFRDTTSDDVGRIQSAVHSEEATPGNGDWAVKLGINLYYSAVLSRSPLYSKQMPYNSVIYHVFGRSSTETSPTKSNLYVRKPGKQKKVVVGKWCGKVWMSNQVHPFLAQKYLEEQDLDRSVHAFELPEQKPERDSENTHKTERTPVPRKSSRKRKMVADSGSMKKGNCIDKVDAISDDALESNSYQQCMGIVRSKQDLWIEAEDNSHQQHRVVKGKQAKFIESEHRGSDDSLEYNLPQRHKRTPRHKQAICSGRDEVSDESDNSYHQQQARTLRGKLPNFIGREDALSDDLPEDNSYRRPWWSISLKEAKYMDREDAVSDDSLEDNSKSIEREDEVSDDSMDAYMHCQDRTLGSKQGKFFEQEDAVSDDSMEDNDARQLLLQVPRSKQAKCFKKVVSLSDDSTEDNEHWQRRKRRGKEVKCIEQEDPVSDNSLEDTRQYKTRRAKQPKDIHKGDASEDDSNRQSRKILRGKQMKQVTTQLRPETPAPRKPTLRQLKNQTPELHNNKHQQTTREIDATIEKELEGGPSTRLRKRPPKPQEELETKVKEKQKQKSRKNMKNAVSGKAPVVYSKPEVNDEEYEYQCDIEGCTMSFGLKQELVLHKKNICPVKGCGKKFFSHKYLVQHRRVHMDDRPLKCPWKGCKMSFKWAWARTEHIRVHTGVRPYTCAEPGCGQTFRFVSDFSRHKRKTGHIAKKSRK